MDKDIETPSITANDLDIKDFYNQWWTIEQLVNNFWDSFIDSCKNQIDRQNFKSMENIIKLIDLFIKSKNKKLITCIEECGIEDIFKDLRSCQNQALLQAFCDQKEIYLKNINNVDIDFLDLSEIDIREPNPKSLSNKQIINEVRKGIAHRKYTSLPDGIYINNPKWPRHSINFRAIVKRDFILSFFADWLLFNTKSSYLNEVKCKDVNFSTWFDDNINKIYVEKIKPNMEEIMPNEENLGLGFTSIKQWQLIGLRDYIGWSESTFLKKQRNLTNKEITQISAFFKNHSFGEAELRFCILNKDLHHFCLIIFIGLLYKSSDLTYEEFINNRKIREHLTYYKCMSNEWGWSKELNEIVADLKDKYNYDYSWFLPSYIELKGILMSLLKDIFYEDKTLLEKNHEDRKKIVLMYVSSRIKEAMLKYMSSENYYRERKIEIETENVENELIQEWLDSGEVVAKNDGNLDNDDFVIRCTYKEDWSIESYYCVKDEVAYYKKNKNWEWSEIKKEATNRVAPIDVSEYKNEIHLWEDLSFKEKESYIDMMKEDLMKIFDWAFSVINDWEVMAEFYIEGVLNQLKRLYISNYYINDSSLIPVLKWNPIPEREHLRNASCHVWGFSTLPGINETLLRDPSQVKGTPDWEKIYNLQKLYERCLRKVNECYK